MNALVNGSATQSQLDIMASRAGELRQPLRLVAWPRYQILGQAVMLSYCPAYQQNELQY